MRSGETLHWTRPRPAAGYSYLLLLMAIALIGITAGASVRGGVSLQRHAAEEELLRIGDDFRRALRQYGQSSPAVSCPSELEHLLKDPRFAAPRRHLRHIPIDPLTGQPKWGVVRNGAGQIAGVFSLAEGQPLKRAGFSPGFESFAAAERYADWVFGACGLATAR